jgi:hypothetical protein
MAQKLDGSLALKALGADETSAFSSVREGDVLHLMYPQNVKDGDLLAALITVLASIIPTCVIHESGAGWSEPEWTPESRKHLGGLILAIQAVPESFSHSSSPSDLARISLWITACSAALSRPGGVADAHGDILPSAVGGQKSASKYMLKVISGLRSNVSDDSCLKAIDTLSTLLKLWQKNSAANALSIVRKCKLPWSAVLFKAAPTEVIKGKKRQPDQRVVRSPPKPSRSPWLSSAERSELGNLFKDQWSFVETFRTSFVALEAEQQHRQFNSYVSRIKAKYEELNAISNSVHAKLGKRKYWIERVCKEDKYTPKIKKGESESFLLASHFFKRQLAGLNNPVKKVFSPLTYLDEESYRSVTIWSELITFSDDSYEVSASDFSTDDGDAYRLWQTWADLFKPVFTQKTRKVEDPPLLDSYNYYEQLAGSAPA